MHSVQALVCSEPGSLRLERRIVERRDAGHALVRPLRVGICGTDYHIYEGKHPFLQYPRVMGHEIAAEVVEVPADTGLSVGDLCVVNPYVSCGDCNPCRMGKPNCCVRVSVLGVHEDGGMAGLVSLPAANLIPARGLTVDHCAAVEFLAIGAHAVRRGGVAESDRVLVVGLGPIGLGVALFAGLLGARVAAYDRDARRSARARSIVDAGVLPADGEVLESARDLSGGDGFDVVFDATGNRAAMERSFDYVGHAGRYVLVGVVKDPITFADTDFHRKEMTLLGSRNATSTDFERVMAAMRNGDVPLDRLITHRTTLEGAVRDLPRWATDKSGLVKALIEMGA